MKAILNFLSREKNERKIISNALSEKEAYLQSGKYKIRNIPFKKTVAYKNNKKTSEFIENIEQHTVTKKNESKLKVKIKNFIQFITKRSINLKTKGENHLNGEAILISAEKNIKVFEFNQNKVITFFNDEAIYLKTKRAQKAFKGFFSMPTIKYVDQANAIVEKRINITSYLNWDNKVKECLIIDVFKNYRNYFKSLESKNIYYVKTKDILEEALLVIDDHQLKTQLSQLVPKKYYNNCWPRVKSHGDLHLSNILIENNTYYYIDWESTKEYIFFHDILNLFIRSLNNFNVDDQLKSFYKGKYDNYFTDLFSLFNLKYSKNDILYYIGLYLIERIIVYNTVSNQSTLTINTTLLLKQIMEILELYEMFKD